MEASLLLFFQLAIGCHDYNLNTIQKELAGPNDTAFLQDTSEPLEDTAFEYPDEWTDYYTQNNSENDKIDVLFIIDNSGSMSNNIAELQANFPYFFIYLRDLGANFHIGVVTTDMNDSSHQGKLREAQGYLYIDQNTVSPESVFEDMSNVGIDGSTTEKGRDAAYAALVPELNNYHNNGFRRDSANLLTIFVSDENDFSVNLESSYGYLVTEDEFVDFLNNLKTPTVKVISSCIVSTDENCGDLGESYMNTSLFVGGSIHSICDSDWSPVLNQLGLDAAALLQSEFSLTYIPNRSTITVTFMDINSNIYYQSRENDGYWHYNAGRNSIVFYEDYIPIQDSTVSINYDLAN